MSIFGICVILYFNLTCLRTVCTFIAEIDSMCSSDLLSRVPPRRRHVNCIKKCSQLLSYVYVPLTQVVDNKNRGKSKEQETSQ